MSRSARRPGPNATALAALFRRAPWKFVSAAEHGPLLQEWIDGNPDHAGQRAEDWLRTDRGREIHLAVDHTGPVVFLRMSQALRFDMEFAPRAERRIAAVMPTGLAYVAGMARERGIHHLLTETRGEPLGKLLQRLGWQPLPAEYVYAL